uniref:Uncharacterized protein n=1 Tax=Oryza rufipogon TaxID=4529 RepID=A0A0E0NX76_ORYRU
MQAIAGPIAPCRSMAQLSRSPPSRLPLAHAHGAAAAQPVRRRHLAMPPTPSPCRRCQETTIDVICHLTPPTSAAEPNRHHQPISGQSWRRAPLLHAAVAEFSLSSSSATVLRHRLSSPINRRRCPLFSHTSELSELFFSLSCHDRPMPATGRSPPLLLPCLFPFTIGFASLR